MSNFLSIAETTAFAMTTCKGATAEDRHLFRVWCVAAMRDLGPNKDWVKVEAIYPRDFSFRKPTDLVSSISIALYTVDNREIPFRFISGSKRIHTDRQSINSGQSTTLDLGEDGEYFHLSSNATEISYMLIRYFAMPIDQEGFPLIKEENLLAYESFCRWMWAKRQDDNRSKIEQDYGFWVRERDRVKGNNKMPSMSEGERIFKNYLSLCSAPSFDTH